MKKIEKIKNIIALLLCVGSLTFLFFFGRTAQSQNYNMIVGKPFNAIEMREVYNKTKKLITLNEGLRLKAYHLKGEYRLENKKLVKLWTACYGNTEIRNKEGKFVRFIKPNEVFTKKQCDEIYQGAFEYYQKGVYNTMTDSEGKNYFNKMLLNEYIFAMDTAWHNGIRGSNKVLNALTNFVKYRSREGFKRLARETIGSLKKNKKYNDFKTRREKLLLLLIGKIEF